MVGFLAKPCGHADPLAFIRPRKLQIKAEVEAFVLHQDYSSASSRRRRLLCFELVDL